MAAIPIVTPPAPPAPAPKIMGLETPVWVIGAQYCVAYDVELKVVEKAISLDDASASVTDANGNMMFKLKGRFLGIHDKRWLCDVNGVPIVTMQKKLRSVHWRWNMFRGDSTKQDNLICTIRQPNIIQIKLEFHVFLAGNKSEETCDFKVKKGNNSMQVNFYLGNTDRIIAQMNVRQNMTTMILEQDAYGLTVFTNMDYAFIVAITTILDADRDSSGS